MDCAICFEAITADTGHTEMSCTHRFHYTCLTRWFGNQVLKDLTETCPCCRHEANEHEGLPDQFDDDEEEEAESSESSESESEEEISSEQAAANERARHHFAEKKAALSEEAFQSYAATRIQAAMRAYPIRMDWIRYKVMLDEKESMRNHIRHLEESERKAEKERQTLMRWMTVPRSEWRNLCATKIQTLWRASSARRALIQVALKAGYKVNWTFDGAAWKRSFLKGVEMWQPANGFPPQSLMFQNHQMWTKVQAAWRAYRVRKVLKKHDGKGAVRFNMPILNAVLVHLGGGSLTYSEFRQMKPLTKEAFRDLCARNGARNPTEIDWRQAAAACDWIPQRMEEDLATMSTNERSSFVPRVKYSGFLEGWILSVQYHQKRRVMAAAKTIQSFWIRIRNRAL
jgi:hypothetical protein